MIRRPPCSTPTAPCFPDPTLFRSVQPGLRRAGEHAGLVTRPRIGHESILERGDPLRRRQLCPQHQPATTLDIEFIDVESVCPLSIAVTHVERHDPGIDRGKRRDEGGLAATPAPRLAVRMKDRKSVV